MDGPLWSEIGVTSGPQNAGLPVLPAKGIDLGKLEPCARGTGDRLYCWMCVS